MTKKITPESLAELPVMVDTVTSAGLAVADRQPDHWQRQAALEFAITFHKNNGGMSQPQHVVATATVFLDFITGDSK
jgi:hypothetical protein